MRVKHVIIYAIRQWSEARGNRDVVFTEVVRSNYRKQVLDDDNDELNEFFEDEDAYFRKHGWEAYATVDGCKGLRRIPADATKAE